MSMSCFQPPCLRQQAMYSWYCTFCVPKLFRFAIEGQWHKIPQRCQTNPNEAKFVHKYAPNDTALHRMVRPPDETGMEYISTSFQPEELEKITQIRLHALAAIVDACPAVASKTDCFGRTPLHLACMDISYSFGAAELLVDACPMSASLQDNFGRTPLHYLVSNNKTIPLAVLEKVVAAFPDAATLHDKQGQCPVSASGEHMGKVKAVLESLNGNRRRSLSQCTRSTRSTTL